MTKEWTNQMRYNKTHPVFTVFACLTILLAANVIRASDDSDVRATVEQVFQQLKNKNYEALYDTLPAGSRARMSRDRFTNALRRTQDFYVLDRVEIGKVNVSGNIASVDTVIYGTVANTEGRD